MSAPSASEARHDARTRFAQGEDAAAETALRQALPDTESAAMLRDHLITEGRIPEALEIARAHADPVDRALEHHAAERFEQALEICNAVLAERPDDPRANLHLARAAFNLGRRDQAFSALRRAVTAAPDFAEGWYALAHALRAIGRLEEACDAYQQALDSRPGLRSARLNLGITRFALDDATGALACFNALLERDGQDVEALVNSGVALQLQGDIRHATERLSRALAIDPDHADAHRYLGTLYNEAGRTEAAAGHLERALASTPDDPDLYAELAAMHELSSRLDAAGDMLRQGLARAPGHPRLNIEAARLDRRRGKPDQALQRLGRLDPGTLPRRLAQQYFHEAGLALDRLDRADEAMDAFETANRISASNPRARATDREAFWQRLNALASWLETASLPPRITGDGGDTGADLCFLIGFPRSGTTLLDTMLDAHPEIAGIEEKPTLEPVIARIEARPGGYPAGLDDLSATDLERFRRLYRDTADPYLADSPRRLVLDKLPLRQLDTALIRRLFPDARLLFLQRHPCDVVLSNFMQLFEPNYAFIHTDTLASSVKFYAEVMRLWPMQVRQAESNLACLRYEDLVTDPRGELERLCGFLGLELHPDMIDTDKRTATRGRVRTNSYHQVAESLYTRSINRWTRYRKHLAPYLETLRPHAEGMGYSVDVET